MKFLKDISQSLKKLIDFAKNGNNSDECRRAAVDKCYNEEELVKEVLKYYEKEPDRSYFSFGLYAVSTSKKPLNLLNIAMNATSWHVRRDAVGNIEDQNHLKEILINEKTKTKKNTPKKSISEKQEVQAAILKKIEDKNILLYEMAHNGRKPPRLAAFEQYNRMNAFSEELESKVSETEDRNRELESKVSETEDMTVFFKGMEPQEKRLLCLALAVPIINSFVFFILETKLIMKIYLF
jgi:hypothetical protein